MMSQLIFMKIMIALKLIDKLDLLRKYYKMMELPKNRIEFENRALLFQFLNDLEDFLVIKKEFKEYSNYLK